MQFSEVIGKKMFFVHKGTWENDYEWRIEPVKITGIKVDEKGKLFVEFSFGCVGYEYPFAYLKKTLKEAKSFAISQINAEKEKQIAQINKY